MSLIQYPASSIFLMELFDLKKLKKIHDTLARKKETIAVAESVTAGLLQVALAQAENASEFFQGGITVYNLGQKFRHLGVEPIECANEKTLMLRFLALRAAE